MIRISTPIGLVIERCLSRAGIALIIALTLAWLACSSHPLTQPAPQSYMNTDTYMTVAPRRLIDLVFMIDNSPSMAPKQEKLKAQFPKLIAALKDPRDGTLPDLRIAIIDSDLGTGNAYPNGACGPKTLADGTVSAFGDLGRFQMVGAAGCGVTSPDALWLEYKLGKPVNYAGDIENVFACLAGNLGTVGCGEEHQLQAFELALAEKGIGNDDQQKFLRPNAYLGLVFVSDEDDCSAAGNDGMFGDKPELRGESASLRCSTRAHTCGGKNLTSSPPGYPTDAPFSAPFAACAARTDDCPNPTDGTESTNTAQPTACSPLKGVKRLADEIKALKDDPEQILVAGIFGWPRPYEDMAQAEYRIDMIPNPNSADSAHPQIYDYWPVCYDPDHLPADPNTYDPSAAGWGATGGLRLSAFIDEFGPNGLKFSICERDFSNAMSVLGQGFVDYRNPCIDYKLVDADPVTAGVQADCRVFYRTPMQDPLDANKVVYVEDAASMPRCDPGQSDDTQTAYPCWKLVIDMSKCPVNGELINIVRNPTERSTPLVPGTKVGMQCWTCTDPVPGIPPSAGCDY
jgi:hypothetical protein